MRGIAHSLRQPGGPELRIRGFASPDYSGFALPKRFEVSNRRFLSTSAVRMIAAANAVLHFNHSRMNAKSTNHPIFLVD